MIKYKVMKQSLNIEEVKFTRETNEKIWCQYQFDNTEKTCLENKETQGWKFFNTKQEAVKYILDIAKTKKELYSIIIQKNITDTQYKLTKHDIDIAKLTYLQEVITSSIVALSKQKIAILETMKKKPLALEFYKDELEFYTPIDKKLQANTDNNSTAISLALTENQATTFASAVFDILELLEKHGQTKEVWDKIEKDNNLVHSKNYVCNRSKYEEVFNENN